MMKGVILLSISCKISILWYHILPIQLFEYIYIYIFHAHSIRLISFQVAEKNNNNIMLFVIGGSSGALCLLIIIVFSLYKRYLFSYIVQVTLRKTINNCKNNTKQKITYIFMTYCVPVLLLLWRTFLQT